MNQKSSNILVSLKKHQQIIDQIRQSKDPRQKLDSYCKLLEKIREKSLLSFDQITSQTNISLSYLQAIFNADIESFPSKAHFFGHSKSVLKIMLSDQDSDQIIELLKICLDNSTENIDNQDPLVQEVKEDNNKIKVNRWRDLLLRFFYKLKNKINKFFCYVLLKNFSQKKLVVLIVSLLVVMLGVVLFAFFYPQYHQQVNYDSEITSFSAGVESLDNYFEDIDIFDIENTLISDQSDDFISQIITEIYYLTECSNDLSLDYDYFSSSLINQINSLSTNSYRSFNDRENIDDDIFYSKCSIYPSQTNIASADNTDNAKKLPTLQMIASSDQGYLGNGKPNKQDNQSLSSLNQQYSYLKIHSVKTSDFSVIVDGNVIKVLLNQGENRLFKFNDQAKIISSKIEDLKISYNDQYLGDFNNHRGFKILSFVTQTENENNVDENIDEDN